jgi:hypothetical protein
MISFKPHQYSYGGNEYLWKIIKMADPTNTATATIVPNMGIRRIPSLQNFSFASTISIAFAMGDVSISLDIFRLQSMLVSRVTKL